MNRVLRDIAAGAATAAMAALIPLPALADGDVEGLITAIDPEAQTFVVQGIEIQASPGTDYDDDLTGFSDLRVGQRVEVDYFIREGRHYAVEIELDQ